MRRARAHCVLGLVLAAPLLFAASCEPHTRYRVLPAETEAVPPPGYPLYAAVLTRLTATLDGKPLAPDPEVTRSYARVLRRAGVFTEVEGAGAAPDPGQARLALSSRFHLDPRTGSNVTRSMLIGASLTLLRPMLPYRMDLDGAMRLRVELPVTALERAYDAETRATRYYYHSSDYGDALRVLVQEVSTVNLRSIVGQLRADTAFTAVPTPGAER